MNSVKCAVIINSGAAPLACLRYAYIAITVERFIAMCFYQCYEKWNYPIAIAFVPLTWFEIALFIKRVVLILYENKKIYRSYCSSITTKVTTYFKLIMEIPVLIGVFCLLLITRIISKKKLTLHMRVGMDTLSSRYQIRENMKTTKTMFIATIMFIITSLINLPGVYLLQYFPPSELLLFAITKEMISYTFAIFINAVSILFIIRVDQMHIKTLKWLPHFGCGPSNRVGEQMNQPVSGRQHIEIVEQMWEKEIRK
ncbi:hypothetical protein LOAG_09306 [Loa loa]|uniref:G-protein coupled receptors family 1 profile domain-containing protein n=2 Tax=Loa loa TaxID=7209 RepID=A0A1S0TTF8_LOALO|nr:hypothetical protein LOAG_09306 [Loa loa]EFO19188.1 hypothetical protein LOAG_09306 [Loa loa]